MSDYLDDAKEMLGTGYPSVEIEAPRTVIERRDGKSQEVTRPAFIKLSTAFKGELANISGDALKVWVFISLSINRITEKANPGLRTIADGVGLAVNTVQKALRELEEAELLTVIRGEKRFNLYEVPEYISANQAVPTVSNRDTDFQTVSNPGETVSNPGETVSNPGETVSRSVILNHINQSNQNTPKGDLVDLELSKLHPLSIRKAISEHFKLNVNWETKTSRQFMEWAVGEQITAEQIRLAADAWRMDRQFNWQVPTLKGIFEKWQILMEVTKPEEKHEPTKIDDWRMSIKL